MFGQIPYHLIEKPGKLRGIALAKVEDIVAHLTVSSNKLQLLPLTIATAPRSSKAGKGCKRLEGLPKSEIENCHQSHQSHNNDTPKHLEYLRVYW